MPLDRGIVGRSAGSLPVSWVSTRDMFYAFGSDFVADVDERELAAVLFRTLAGDGTNVLSHWRAVTDGAAR
jgi:hypothetical protein